MLIFATTSLVRHLIGAWGLQTVRDTTNPRRFSLGPSRWAERSPRGPRTWSSRAPPSSPALWPEPRRHRPCPTAQPSHLPGPTRPTPAWPGPPFAASPALRSVGRRLPGSPGSCRQRPGGREAAPGRCGPGLPVSAPPPAGGGRGTWVEGDAPLALRGPRAAPEGGAGVERVRSQTWGQERGDRPGGGPGLGVRRRCPHGVPAGSLGLSQRPAGLRGAGGGLRARSRCLQGRPAAPAGGGRLQVSRTCGLHLGRFWLVGSQPVVLQLINPESYGK